MPDRDKVIKAIDICLGHGKCGDCGYHASNCYTDQNCRGRMLRDVLDLLKEQEPVIATRSKEYEEYWDRKYTCSNCDMEWMTATEDPRYCPKCGRKVKWDE